jgi:hypothetical protein
MVGLKTLGIIDERLRKVFPGRGQLCLVPFGGLNIRDGYWAIIGSYIQPVGGHPLFKQSGTKFGASCSKGLSRADPIYSGDEVAIVAVSSSWIYV